MLIILCQCRTECFCGHNEPLAKYKLPDPDCNYKCSGDAKQICGGYFTINVYETGIISTWKLEARYCSVEILTKKYFSLLSFAEFDPQVAELIPKENVNKVKIAFLLTLNGRAVRQVHRLLKSLYDKNHFYYIHVDEVICFCTLSFPAEFSNFNFYSDKITCIVNC